MPNLFAFSAPALFLVVSAFSPADLRAQAPAQGSGPCQLLMSDEIQSLAPNTTIAEGAMRPIDAAGIQSCRYVWGEGVGHYTLDVSLFDASRTYSGVGAEAIREQLRTTVTEGTADAIIADVGDAAIFKADSPVYVHATAYVKGRLLAVYLDGIDARGKKDQLIALLKSAVARL